MTFQEFLSRIGRFRQKAADGRLKSDEALTARRKDDLLEIAETYDALADDPQVLAKSPPPDPR